MTPPPPRNYVQYGLIALALGYLTLLLFLPAVNIFVQAFAKGPAVFWQNLSRPAFLSALRLTLGLALVTVPLNTVFGLCAAWAIARKRFPGKTLLLSMIDLPFSISPVVAGLMLVLLYGREGWFAPLLRAMDCRVLFGFPGMVLATAFVSLPFVVREVLPVLEEMGHDQEEAAKTLGASDWQTFWRVTLPNIRLGVLYGVVLTNARVMGEFGAVAVVSGNIINQTQTLPLFVEDAYKQYNTEAAYGAATLLALLAVVTLILKTLLERQNHRTSAGH
ncbi:MAG: sulfate ABC transporter permease subunit CysW [Pseudanabaenaceae cyanobacterium]